LDFLADLPLHLRPVGVFLQETPAGIHGLTIALYHGRRCRRILPSTLAVRFAEVGVYSIPPRNTNEKCLNLLTHGMALNKEVSTPRNEACESVAFQRSDAPGSGRAGTCGGLDEHMRQREDAACGTVLANANLGHAPN